MSEAKLFDRGTLRVVDDAGDTQFERVRVIARRDRVELFALERDHAGEGLEVVTRGVVRVATFDGATVRAMGARVWNLELADGSVLVMRPDGRCSTCSGNPLGAARL